MAPSPEPTDPVVRRRRQVQRWALLANRIGYLLYALAMAVFVMGLAFTFNSAVVAVTVGALVAGSVLLAPSIVLQYAVKAADREDRERGLGN
jgi:hypothetical protein